MYGVGPSVGSNGPMERLFFLTVLVILMFYLIGASQSAADGMVNVDGPRVVFEAGYRFLRWIGLQR